MPAAPAIAARPGDEPAPAGRAGRLALVALLGPVGLATVAASLAGRPLLALVPVALAAVGFAMARVPLRWSAAAFLFLLLGVDDTREITGQWRTPLAFLGNLVHDRLDLVTPLPVSATGMEVLCAVLLLVWAHRRAVGAGSEIRDRVPAVAALRAVAVVAVAAVALGACWGVLHGQDWVPWKIRNLVHPFLLFLVFDAAFRGPADHALVARVVVASAAARALLAVAVQRIAVAETGGKFLAATSHGDSVLFAVATYLVLSELIARAGPRRFARGVLLLAILLAGMVENERRLVWVMVLLALCVTYAVTPMRGLKRRLTRVAVVVAPVLALYVSIGWNRGGRLFAPVQTLRGVSDTSYDHSAYWREVENWNIAVSMRERPIVGTGLGGQYTEHMHNDDISADYPEYRQWPHNTILGLLLLLGVVGFTAAWSPFAAALFLALRSHRLARAPEHRVAALACASAIVACHVLAYGDTGAHYPQYKVLMGLALAFAGKLAVVTGAWPSRRATPTLTVLEHAR